MNRFVKSIALSALLLNTVPALAADTTQQFLFTTYNQDIWNTPNGITNNFALNTSWSDGGEIGGYSNGWGLKLGGGSSGDVGLNFTTWIKGGKVAINYPVAITLHYPDPGTVRPGQTFTISSSWNVANPQQASIQTSSPTAGAAVDFYLNTNVRAYVKASAANNEFLNSDIVNFPINFDHLRLLNTDEWPDTSFNLLGVLGCEKKSVSLAGTGGMYPYNPAWPEPAGSEKWLQCKASSTFLKLSGNFTNLAAKLARLPVDLVKTGTAGFSVPGFDIASIDYDYALADLFGEVPLTLQQTLNFMPTPRITLALSNNQTVSFNAGESVQVTLPANMRQMTIMPTISMTGTLHNVTAMTLQPNLKYQPLRFHAHGTLLNQSLGDLDFHPFEDMDVATTSVFYPLAYQDQWVGNFNIQRMSQINIFAQ